MCGAQIDLFENYLYSIRLREEKITKQQHKNVNVNVE